MPKQAAPPEVTVDDFPAAGQPRKAQPVTSRAFLIGLLVSLGVCALTPYNDYFVAATYLSGNFFPISALGTILLLTLAVNPLLIRSGRRHRCFSPAEIITVWAMIIATVGIPSSGLMRYLIPHIVAPHYFATAANGWEGTLISRLPPRLLVHDPNAVLWFFEGLPRGAGIPWAAWEQPLAWWGLFVALLFLAFFCLSALIRRQWVENERFAFPLVTLPVLLAEQPEYGRSVNSLLRSPLLWLGVGLVTVLHTANGLHQLVPTFPAVPTVWNSSDFLTVRPWSAVNNIEFAVYPLVVGFSYLLSSEVCLSLWLFYLLFKAQVLLGVLYNWDMPGLSGGIVMGPAFAAYQEAGGAVALTLWTGWAMRGHLRDVWRKAVHGDPGVDDAREPLPYRFALFGLAAAYAGLFAWLAGAAGVQPLMALGILLGSLVVFILLSYLVAQAGVLFMQQTFLPSQLMTAALGSLPFDARSLVMAPLVEHVGWFDAREIMMPSLLNGYKAAAETALSARSLARALAVAVVLATVVSAAVSVWLPYTHGGGTALKNVWGYVMAPQMPLTWAAAQVSAPHGPDGKAMLQMGGGGVFVLAVLAARSLLPAFSLHPAGFFVAGSYPMYTLWFSLLLGWVVKGPLVRYGGMKGYRAALPLFMGLIIGDCLNALCWVGIGLATGKAYSVLPG